MAGFVQNLLKDAAGAFFGSDYLRDYTHASKTFRTNSYQNAPKLKFLFHTYFDINTAAYSEGLSTGRNFGLLVRDIKLPSFSFNTTQLNQYNRKRIVQTKIKYDPITISFHDDAGNTINKLWNAYYQYYYADGTKPKVVFAGARGGLPQTQVAGGGTNTINTLADYNARTTYNPSITGNDDWGYTGESSSGVNSPSGTKIPFFKNITVFGFDQHRFTAYTLINPIITTFAHDTYAYDEASGTMKNTMTIDYETVVYNTGNIDGRKPSDIVTGFGMPENYDRTLSPISVPGANGTILGQGGLVDAAGGAISDLANGNILGAIQKAGTAYNTFKNKDLKATAAAELTTMARNSLQNTPNTRNTLFDFPGSSTTPGPAGLAGSPTIGAQPAPTNIGLNRYAGTQISSNAATSGAAPVINILGGEG